MVHLPIYIFTQENNIKLLGIIFKDNINYYSFYHKKTFINDEIDTSKNISLITNQPNLRRIKGCEIKIFPDEIIISHDINYPDEILKDYKINNDIENHLVDYFVKRRIEKNFLYKKGKYKLLKVKEENSIILVLELSIKYFNAISNNLKIIAEEKNEDEKIKVYKILNGLDEDLIEEWKKTYTNKRK
jgi:hypothetical protein